MLSTFKEIKIQRHADLWTLNAKSTLRHYSNHFIASLQYEFKFVGFLN